MYRKDGIANLDIIILVAKDTVLPGFYIAFVCICVRAYVRLCIYVHSSE